MSIRDQVKILQRFEALLHSPNVILGSVLAVKKWENGICPKVKYRMYLKCKEKRGLGLVPILSGIPDTLLSDGVNEMRQMSNITSDSTNTSETDRRVHYQLPMIIKIDENLFHFIDNFYYFSTIAFVLFVNWIYLVLYLIMKKYEVVFIDLDSVGYFV